MNECCYAARDSYCSECVERCNEDKCELVSALETIIDNLKDELAIVRAGSESEIERLQNKNNALKIMLNAARQKLEVLK